MSENPLHYTSDAPCAKCKGRTRYKTTRGCVPCQKAHTKRKRKRASASELAMQATFRGPLITPVQIDMQPWLDGSDLLIAHLLDDGSDLL